MCMMQTSSPPSVKPEPIEALSGKGLTTNTNPLFKSNKPSKTRKVNRSLTIKKPKAKKY